MSPSKSGESAEIDLRPAEPNDLVPLVELLVDAERHYWGVKPGQEEIARGMAEALLGGDSDCRMLIAWRGARALGYATYVILHPAITPAGTFFLKDLYVRSDGRGDGVGEIMLRHLAGMADERGCQRFDWTAESDNPRALDFYDRLGAVRVEEKVYYRLTGAEIRRFAGEEP